MRLGPGVIGRAGQGGERLAADPLRSWWPGGFWSELAPEPAGRAAHRSDAFGRQLRDFVRRRHQDPPVQQARQADTLANLLLASAGPVVAQLALAQLIIGQSRLAWRLTGAWPWLETAEREAARHADPRTYLILQRHHVLLRELPLFEHPRAHCQTLEALLREAAIIRYLRHGR